MLFICYFILMGYFHPIQVYVGPSRYMYMSICVYIYIYIYIYIYAYVVYEYDMHHYLCTQQRNVGRGRHYRLPKYKQNIIIIKVNM